MRAAPPVSVRACGGRRWRLVRAGLPALAVWACVRWLVLQIGVSAAWPADLLAMLALTAASAVAAIVLIVAWLHSATRPALLAWSGTCWSVDGIEGRLDLMFDLPGWLLVRLQPPAGRARWVAVAAREAGADETLLRAALYAHAGAGRASRSAA